MKHYIVIKEVDVPVVVRGSVNNMPPLIKTIRLKKNQIIKGELKHANNEPAIVLMGKRVPVPIECLQEVKSVPITGKDTQPTTAYSNASGDEQQPPKTITTKPTKPVMRYADGALLGGLAGLLGVYLAQKKGLISEENGNYRIYGALAGATLGVYAIWRFMPSKTATPQIINKPKE